MPIIRDPRDFAPRTDAPSFDIVKDKDDWEVWKIRWKTFLGVSGISRLNAIGADDVETAARKEALREIKRDAMYNSLSTETIRLVCRLPLTEMQRDCAEDVIEAIQTHIKGGQGPEVPASQQEPEGQVTVGEDGSEGTRQQRQDFPQPVAEGQGDEEEVTRMNVLNVAIAEDGYQEVWTSEGPTIPTTTSSGGTPQNSTLAQTINDVAGRRYFWLNRCTYTCKVCPGWNTNCLALTSKHLRKEHEMDLKTYVARHGNPLIKIVNLRCRICAKDIVNDVSYVRRHLWRCHRLTVEEYHVKYHAEGGKHSSQGSDNLEDYSKGDDASVKSETFPYQCGTCGYVTGNEDRLKRHAQSAHEEKRRDYSCENCDYTAASYRRVKSHHKTVHDEIRDHLCDRCDFATASRSSLRDHVTRVHPYALMSTTQQQSPEVGHKDTRQQPTVREGTNLTREERERQERQEALLLHYSKQLHELQRSQQEQRDRGEDVIEELQTHVKGQDPEVAAATANQQGPEQGIVELGEDRSKWQQPRQDLSPQPMAVAQDDDEEVVTRVNISNVARAEEAWTSEGPTTFSEETLREPTLSYQTHNDKTNAAPPPTGREKYFWLKKCTYACKMCPGWNANCLSATSKHLRTKHRMDLRYYVSRHGNPMVKIANLRCKICAKDIVNDVGYVRRHLGRCHRLALENYHVRYHATEEEEDRDSNQDQVSSDHLPDNSKDHASVKRKTFPYQCGTCGYATGNKSRLKRHDQSAHERRKKAHSCEYCDYSAAAHHRLKSHRKEVHDRVRDYRCDMCDYAAASERRLLSHHDALHDEGKKYECDQCDFASPCRSSLVGHVARGHYYYPPSEVSSSSSSSAS